MKILTENESTARHHRSNVSNVRFKFLKFLKFLIEEIEENIDESRFICLIFGKVGKNY